MKAKLFNKRQNKAAIVGFSLFCLTALLTGHLCFGSRLAYQLSLILDQIGMRQAEMGDTHSGTYAPAEKEKGAVAFTSRMGGEEGITIQTLFNAESPTVEKRTVIKRGIDTISYTATLKSEGQPYTQTVRNTSKGDLQVYYNDKETIVYSQNKEREGSISLKEWIHTLSPNTEQGSAYTWSFSGDTPISLEQSGDGSVEVFRSMQITGINNLDARKRASVVESVRKALGDRINFNDKERIATISRPL